MVVGDDSDVEEPRPRPQQSGLDHYFGENLETRLSELNTSMKLDQQPETRREPIGLNKSGKKLKEFDFDRVNRRKESCKAWSKGKSKAEQHVEVHNRKFDDKLNNRLSFLLKTYADSQFKSGVGFAGFGKILSGLEVFKYFKEDDLAIAEILRDVIILNPASSKDEVAECLIEGVAS